VLIYAHINQNVSITQKLIRNRDQRRVVQIRFGDLLSFTFKKWGFVYTVHQSLINWLLLRRYSGSWDQC